MESKLCKVLILLVIISVTFVFSAYSRTTLGVALEKNFTESNLWYGGYLRTGRLLAFELAGMVPSSPASSTIQAFTYLLLDLELASFSGCNSVEMYIGASPDITVDLASPSFHLSSSTAYGKSGIQINIGMFAFQFQGVAKFKFTGEIDGLIAGMGAGLAF